MSRSVEKEWGAKWTEELDRRGFPSVVATLASGVGPGRASPYHLFIQGMPEPTREFVEGWICRREAAEKATETRRFWLIFVAAVLAVVVGIIAAWPVIHGWIR